MPPIETVAPTRGTSPADVPEPPEQPPAAAGPARRRVRFLVPGLAVLGVVAVVVAGRMQTSALVRIPLAVVGLVSLAQALKQILHRRGIRTPVSVLLAVGWLVVVVLAAVGADLLPLPEARNPAQTLVEPVLARPGLGEHLLGTDKQGLDILGGIAYGFRVSLVVGVGAAVIAMVIGGAMGVVAGYFRGRLDRATQFLTTSLLAFPPLILLMGLAAVLNPTVPNVTAALIVVVIPTFARMARGSTMVVAQHEYVQASRVLGARHPRILLRDIVPAIAQPLISYALVMVSMLVVAEASLSYLGLGIPRPEPTLGNMISAGKDDFDRAPHLVFCPALALFLTVLSLNLLGEHLRKVWDRRESHV